jgi:hypothetical protein
MLSEGVLPNIKLDGDGVEGLLIGGEFTAGCDMFHC